MTERAKKKSSLARRILRVVLVVLGAIVALVLGFVGWLHTSSGKNYVRDRVLEAVRADLRGDVALGELDYALFGGLTIGKLVIHDDAGIEAIALDRLEIRPIWASLFRDEKALEVVRIKGVRLHVVVAADGSTNLDHLAKTPPPKAKPGGKKKPASAIRLAAFEIDDVAVLVDRADGTRASIRLDHADGSVEADPAKGGLDLSIPKLRAEFALDGKDGAGVGLRGIETAAKAHLTGGEGNFSVGPTRAHLELVAPGNAPRGVDFELAPLEAHVAPGDLSAAMGRLSLGALAIQAVEVHGHEDKSVPAGEQKASIVGITIDATKANDLAGKRVLASNVTAEIGLTGPPDKLALDASLHAGGGSIDLHGTLDASHMDNPGYVVHLEGHDLDSSRIAGEDLAVPPARVQRFAVDVKGHGIEPIGVDATVHAEVDGIEARGARVDHVVANASFQHGEAVLRDLTVKSMGQEVRAEGSYRLADRHVHADVSPSGKGADAIEPLRKLGIVPKGPISSFAIREGDVHATVDGQVGGEVHASVTAHRIAVAGGTIDLEGGADVSPGATADAPPRVDHARGILTFAGIDASALAGKKLPVAATVSGRVEVGGTEADPKVDAALHVRAHASNDAAAPPFNVDMKAGLANGRAKVHVRAADEADRSAPPLFEADATALVDGREIALDRPIDITFDIPKRKIEDLARYVPHGVSKLLDGEVEAHGRVRGTARRPDGVFDIDVTEAIEGGNQRVQVHALVHPSTRVPGRTAIDADIAGWLHAGGEAPIKAHAEVDAGAGARAPVSWSLALDVAPLAIESLPVPPEKLDGATGQVSAHAHLHGTRDDILGNIELDLAKLQKADRGPLGADVAIAIADASTKIDAHVRAKDASILVVNGKVGLGGKGLLAAAREGRDFDPDLDVGLEIPDEALAAWAPLAPKLAAYPGRLHGTGSVRGKATSPVAKLDVALDHYATLDGHDGRAAVDVAGDAKGVKAKIGLGTDGSDPGVRIEASLPLDGKIGVLSIPEAKVKANADNVDLRSLVPAVAVDGKKVDISGRLDWDMTGAFTVKPTLHGVGLKAHVDGDLAIAKGRIALVGTNRVFDGVELKISTDDHELRIDKLKAHEADAEKPNRTLELHGAVGWQDLAPERADMHLSAHDWLLFGGEKLGQPDAPRGVVSAEVAVRGDLDGPLKTLDVDVNALTLRVPDRLDKSHQPEVVSVGDVLDLGDRGVKKGKLAPQTIEAESKPAPASGDDNSGVDVHVRLKNTARLEQAPIDLLARGGVDVAVRPGRRSVRGKLDIVGGALSLGGKQHPIDHGAVVFDEAHPGGFMDLHFARAPKAETLRDMSQESSTDAVRIDMVGPVGKQKVTLGGAGNGSLYDLLAVDNAGRERFVSAPGLPTSETAQLPRFNDVLALSFLSVNMPHLLFLDRISAWADPYASPGSYGRTQNVEAERTSDSGHARVRAVERPPTAGESTNEVELDWLFGNSRRSAVGVGVTAGDRGGGGPDVFFEWETKD